MRLRRSVNAKYREAKRQPASSITIPSFDDLHKTRTFTEAADWQRDARFQQLLPRFGVK